MKLLIVDDHELNLRLLRAQLEGEGHEVIEAADGVAAMELLEAESVDGVVSDILMPRMDGYRLCMEIRGRPALARLPFVLYTSTYNSAGDRQLAESLGADAYLSKPAPTSRIMAALLAAGDGRRQDQAPSEPLLTAPEPLMKQYNQVLVRKLEEKGAELERTHEVLVESRARLSGLITTAMDAIVAVNEARRIVLFNPAAGRMFGIDPDAALGRSLNDFIPPHARDAHERHIEGFSGEITQARAMQAREVMGLRADGSEFPIEANISRLQTSNGQLFTAFIRDVTERRQAQSALREREAGLRRAQEVAKMAHAIVGADGSVLGHSPSLPALFGPSDDGPHDRREWLERVHEEDRPALSAAWDHVMTQHSRCDCEYRVSQNGGWHRIRHIFEPLDEGTAQGGAMVFSTLQDITSEYQAQEKIRQLNHVYAVLSAINSLIVRASDRDQLFEQACAILVGTGRFAKAWIGMVDEGMEPLRILAWAGAEDAYFEGLQERLSATASDPGVIGSVLLGGGPAISNDIANDASIKQRETLVASGSRSLAILPLTLAGRTVGVVSIHSPIVGFFDEEETKLLLGLAHDVSFALDHLSKSDRIAYLANHDALTGLPNRSLYTELLTQHLAEPDCGEHLACVALLDLVRFRRINETLGRACGDQLLLQVAERLRAIDPFVARLGADAFALQFNERRTAAELAHDFEYTAAQCFDRPFLVASEEVRLGCRIGAAVSPGDGDDAEALLRNAESALRRARADAAAFVFYAPDMNASASQALELESKLRRAIEREEFVLHYQPKLRLSDRRICGVEALIRWQDPDRGLVAPMSFIPVLEETGLIGAVGQWALRRALDDCRQWQAAGARAIRVAVNVSPRQLNQPNFVAQISLLAADGGSAFLELEITESVIMDDVDRKVVMLSQVRDLGVTIAIDDFGTGYSSLAYISRLPVTSLKIDRAFVTGMIAGPDGYILVSSIIALAHALKLKVVAEGVETEEQAHMLSLLKCEEAQGYLFSKPVPGSRFLELLLADLPLP